MIKLEDISLRFYTMNLVYLNPRDPEVTALSRYGITNYQQLIDHIESGNPEFQKPLFKRMIDMIEKNLKKLEEAEEIPIYYKCSFPEYESLFKKTDVQVRSDRLPFYSPSQPPSASYRLSIYNMSLAKELLGKAGVSGKNAFCELVQNFGVSKAKRMGMLANFYDEQLARVIDSASNTETLEENLFDKDREKKRKLVARCYEDIIFYLCDHPGFITRISPTLLLKSLVPSKKEDYMVRNRIIEIISDFCTLEEIESGLIEKDTLKRFIIEPNGGNI